MDGCEAAREEKGVVPGKGPSESGCCLVDCVEGDGRDDDEGGHENCGRCWGAGGFFPDEVDGESKTEKVAVIVIMQEKGGDAPCWRGQGRLHVAVAVDDSNGKRERGEKADYNGYQHGLGDDTLRLETLFC